MRKHLIRKILLLICGMFVASILALTISPFFINANVFKSILQRQLQEKSGYRIDINGGLSLQFFPSAVLTARDVVVRSYASPENFKPFATIKHIEAEVNLYKLFKGQVDLTGMRFYRPEFNIFEQQTDKKKNANWRSNKPYNFSDFWQLIRLNDYSDPFIFPGNIPAEKFLAYENKNIKNLEYFEIEDGSVNYEHLTNSRRIQLSQLNLSIDNSLLPSSVHWQGSAVMNGAPLIFSLETENSAINSKADFPQNKQEIQASSNRKTAAISNRKKTATSTIFVKLSGNDFSLKGSGNISKSGYRGNFEGNFTSIADLLYWLSLNKENKENNENNENKNNNDTKNTSNSPQLAQKSSLPLHINGEISCQNLACIVDRFAIKLSDSAIEGAASINVASPKTIVTAQIKSSNINLTPYLPYLRPYLRHSISRDGGRFFDFSALAAINGDLILRADKLAAGNFSADKVSLLVNFSAGNMNADMVADSLYEGVGRFSLRLNQAGYAEGNVNLSSVKIQPLLADFSLNSPHSGKGDLRLNLKTHGRSENDFIANMEGGGELRLVNPLLVIPGFAELETSRVDDLYARFAVETGAVENINMIINSPSFSAHGKGMVDILNRNVDILLLVKKPELKAQTPLILKISGAPDSISAVAAQYADWKKRVALYDQIEQSAEKLAKNSTKNSTVKATPAEKAVTTSSATPPKAKAKAQSGLSPSKTKKIPDKIVGKNGNKNSDKKTP